MTIENEHEDYFTELTPPGTGAISIIATYGKTALSRLMPAFSGFPEGEDLVQGKMYNGRIRFTDGSAADEAVIAIEAKPCAGCKVSPGGIDIIKICPHGGTAVVEAVAKALDERGFIRRPVNDYFRFMYDIGRLDYVQFEAAEALLSATTEKAAELLAKAHAGSLSNEIAKLIRETADSSPSEVVQRLRELVETYGWASKLVKPPFVVLIGAPNSGKTTLANRLAHDERGIVTDTPGTTRDIIERQVSLNGWPAVVADTAGLRPPEGEAEAEGHRRAHAAVRRADLVVNVVDITSPADPPLIAGGLSIPTVVALNKSDLAEGRLDNPPDDAVTLSAKSGDGVPELVEAIFRALGIGGELPEGPAIFTERQYTLLSEAIGAAGDPEKFTAVLETVLRP